MRSISPGVEYTYADARTASVAPNRFRSGRAAISPALTAMPRASNARATDVGAWPSTTKVKTGTRRSAPRGPMIRTPWDLGETPQAMPHEFIIVTSQQRPGGFEESNGCRESYRARRRQVCPLGISSAACSKSARSKSTSCAMLLPTW